MYIRAGGAAQAHTQTHISSYLYPTNKHIIKIYFVHYPGFPSSFLWQLVAGKQTIELRGRQEPGPSCAQVVISTK